MTVERWPYEGLENRQRIRVNTPTGHDGGSGGFTVRQVGLDRPLGSLDPALDLSIVIVNWNTRDLLDACLTSVCDYLIPLCGETIVVDNGSSDGSADMVAQQFPGVHLIVNATNKGFATANNQGLELARGRYILLLNSDTLVQPDALERMVRYIGAHPSVGALGPRLLNADRSLQSSARNFPRLLNDSLGFLEVRRWPLVGRLAEHYDRATALYWDDHRQTREVDWLMGACLLLRREALEQVGLLDEGYFFFAEEADLCYRLRRSGWSIVFFADADIVHLGGQSSAQVPARRLVWHYTSALRFYCLHRSGLQQSVLRAVIAFAATTHIASLLVRHRQATHARAILNAYLHVLVRAIR